MTSTPDALQCGPNADDRYCTQFWNLTAEAERLEDEVKRLQALIRELLDCTGLDDDEQAEWLARAAIHDDGEDD